MDQQNHHKNILARRERRRQEEMGTISNLARLTRIDSDSLVQSDISSQPSGQDIAKISAPRDSKQGTKDGTNNAAIKQPEEPSSPLETWLDNPHPERFIRSSLIKTIILTRDPCPWILRPQKDTIIAEDGFQSTETQWERLVYCPDEVKQGDIEVFSLPNARFVERIKNDPSEIWESETVLETLGEVADRWLISLQTAFELLEQDYHERVLAWRVHGQRDLTFRDRHGWPVPGLAPGRTKGTMQG
ncbi:hypothetical protein F53441_1292 [Fusarium austroafricanum]|uniref:Uncharacterized protein n=1 Tax=Fusarium austroafricanum TaxID=2364996 RepID=A0A8H4KVV5_9HYPO|nr:hypothetical protein F53441_1292 [Fusarium austroafricanum]